jgi:hypothetical protein
MPSAPGGRDLDGRGRSVCDRGIVFARPRAARTPRSRPARKQQFGNASSPPGEREVESANDGGERAGSGALGLARQIVLSVLMINAPASAKTIARRSLPSLDPVPSRPSSSARYCRIWRSWPPVSAVQLNERANVGSFWFSSCRDETDPHRVAPQIRRREARDDVGVRDFGPGPALMLAEKITSFTLSSVLRMSFVTTPVCEYCTRARMPALFCSAVRIHRLRDHDRELGRRHHRVDRDDLRSSPADRAAPASCQRRRAVPLRAAGLRDLVRSPRSCRRREEIGDALLAAHRSAIVTASVVCCSRSSPSSSELRARCRAPGRAASGCRRRTCPPTNGS